MSRKKRQRSKKVLVLAALVLAGAGWWTWRTYLRTSPQRAPVPRVRVIRREFRITVLATGAVKPQVGAEVRVGARVSGKVMHLRTNIGDHVKKGQVIAELEKADLEAAVMRQRAEVRVAEARVADAKARRDLAELQLQRQVALRRREFTTRDAVDRARRERASASAGLRLARRRVDAAHAALKEAKVRLSYTVITAPIDGVIAKVATQEGETVSAGLMAPTLTPSQKPRVEPARARADDRVPAAPVASHSEGARWSGRLGVNRADSGPERPFSRSWERAEAHPGQAGDGSARSASRATWYWTARLVFRASDFMNTASFTRGLPRTRRSARPCGPLSVLLVDSMPLRLR